MYSLSAIGMACLYISAPPIIKTSSFSVREVLAEFIASSSEFTTFTPWRKYVLSRVITILCLLGRGRPRDSKVFLPIMTGWPRVFSRKNFMSAGRCQSRVLPLPNSLFLPISAKGEYRFDGKFAAWLDQDD